MFHVRITVDSELTILFSFTKLCELHRLVDSLRSENYLQILITYFKSVQQNSFKRATNKRVKIFIRRFGGTSQFSGSNTSTDIPAWQQVVRKLFTNARRQSKDHMTTSHKIRTGRLIVGRNVT
jgi:hypothetical protein